MENEWTFLIMNLKPATPYEVMMIMMMVMSIMMMMILMMMMMVVDLPDHKP